MVTDRMWTKANVGSMTCPTYLPYIRPLYAGIVPAVYAESQMLLGSIILLLIENLQSDSRQIIIKLRGKVTAASHCNL